VLCVLKSIPKSDVIFLKNYEMTPEQLAAHQYYFPTDPTSLKVFRDKGVDGVMISARRVDFNSEVQCREIYMLHVKRLASDLDSEKLLPGRAYLNDAPGTAERAFIMSLGVEQGLDPSTDYDTILEEVLPELKQRFSSDSLPPEVKVGLISGNHSTRAMLLNMEVADEKEAGSGDLIKFKLRYRLVCCCVLLCSSFLTNVNYLRQCTLYFASKMPLNVAEALSNLENQDIAKNLYLESALVLQVKRVRQIWIQEQRPDAKRGRPGKVVNLYKTFLKRVSNIAGVEVKDLESAGKHSMLIRVSVF